jgi:hypothetical protein
MTIDEELAINWTLLMDRLRAIFREPMNIEMLVNALEEVINNTRYGTVSIVIIDGRVSLITEEKKQKVV